MITVVRDGCRTKTNNGRRLIKIEYELPEGYRIEDLKTGFLLIRKSDGRIITRVDDTELLLKRLNRDSFVMSIYELDEWEVLEAFYHYCYRSLCRQKKEGTGYGSTA